MCFYIRLSLITVVVLCTATPQYAQKVPDSAVSKAYSNLSRSWAVLDEGFSYTGTAFDRQLGAGERGERDGEDVLLKIVPYSTPRETEHNIAVVANATSYTVEYDHARTVHVSQSLVADLDASGALISSGKRTIGNEESALRQPVFIPRTLLEQSIEYPFPKRTMRPGDVLDKKVLVDQPSEKIERVTRVRHRGDKTFTSIQEFTIRPVDGFGWLPVLVRQVGTDGEVYNLYELEWGVREVGEAAVPIPTKMRDRGYVLDPASQKMMPISVYGFDLDLSSMKFARSANGVTTDSAPWLKLENQDQYVAGKAPLTPEEAQAEFQPYLITCVLLVAAAVMLWWWHKRRDTKAKTLTV